MRHKSTWVLLLLVLGVGFFIVLVEKDWDTTAEQKVLARRAFRIQPEKITFLRFENKGLRIDCHNDGQGWVLDYPEGARIKKGVVIAVLTAMSKVEKGTLFTPEELASSGRSLSEFGLDKPRARITYGTELAQRTLLIGNDAPLGDVIYVKDMSQPQVMTVDAKLLTLIPTSWAAMRVRDVFTLPEQDVERIEVRRKGSFVVFERRNGDAWELSQPRVNRAKSLAVQGLLQKLEALRVEEFLDGSDDKVEWPVDSDYVRLQSTGERVEQTVYLGAVDKNSGMLRARIDGDELDILLPGELLRLLSIDIDEYSKPNLYPEQDVDPKQIRWTLGEQTLLLSQEEAWQIEEPVKWAINDQRMESFIARIKDLEAQRFLSSAEISTMETTNINPVATLDLAFAHEAEEDAKNRDWQVDLFRLPEFKEVVVFHVPHARLWGILKNKGELSWSNDPLYYRSPIAFTVPEEGVVRIAQKTDEGETVFLREPGSPDWTHAGLAVDSVAIQALLNKLTKLTVLRWVEYLPSDLEPYGLHQPRLQLALGYSGVDSIGNTLLVGAEDEAGNCYGKLLGRDVIFLLSKQDATLLLNPLIAVAEDHEEKVAEPQSEK